LSWSGTSVLVDKEEIARSKVNPEDVLPDFLDSYNAFFQKFQEVVAVEYTDVCGIFALSAALGGRLVLKELDFGWKKVNVFVLLLGDSSISHKTTAIKACERLLRDTGEVEFLSGRFSIEGTLMEIRAAPWGVFIRDEFTGLMVESQKSYIADLKQFLCAVYDCEIGSRTTIKYGKVEIKGECNSFLSGTVPYSLSLILQPDDFKGGMLPRFIIMRPELRVTSGVGVKRLTNQDLSMLVKLRATLLFIINKFPNGTTTEARFDNEAYELFNKWVTGNNDMLSKRKEEYVMFYSRLTEHLAKLSLLYQVSDTNSNPVVNATEGKVDRYLLITKKSVEKAIVWMDKYRDVYLPRALSVLSNVETEMIYNTIKELCTKSSDKTTTYSEVLRANYRYKTDELRKYINTLVDSERITVRKTLKDFERSKKPVETIRLTNIG